MKPRKSDTKAFTLDHYSASLIILVNKSATNPTCSQRLQKKLFLPSTLWDRAGWNSQKFWESQIQVFMPLQSHRYAIHLTKVMATWLHITNIKRNSLKKVPPDLQDCHLKTLSCPLNSGGSYSPTLHLSTLINS
jgi:hypothetical protein